MMVKNDMDRADILIIGAGLSGLVAAHEAVKRGRSVILLDQEGPQSIGGQAFWSLGGLFMINTPEQRRIGIKDSLDLARNDWHGSAKFDRAEDMYAREFAEAYLQFAAGPMRAYLADLGMRWFPAIGWAERGGAFADGHGNSVPRFHVTWGAGEGIVKPFVDSALAAAQSGQITLAFRHRVRSLHQENGRIVGVAGDILADDLAVRGASTNRDVVGDFAFRAENTIITSGGIGGNFEEVRRVWPTDRLGPAPTKMVAGVPDYVDGSMQDIARTAGANLVNEDRMWHYCEGIQNWDPIWPSHGIRVLPGPSSMWFDAHGDRMEAPCIPGCDTLSTLKRILSTGHEHSWMVLTQKIIKKEFALSGSEQNPDLVSGNWRQVIRERGGKSATPAVEAFKRHGKDFVVADNLAELVAGMNEITPDCLLDGDHLRRQIAARDAQLDNKFGKDMQINAIRGFRKFIGDRLMRVAKPHKILDPANGPLIAVRMNILTRKSLGGLQTNLSGQVIRQGGSVFDGLYAAGEAAGFGGGGYHGYNALEGTFLGGCIFSGLKAGQSA